MRVPPQMCWPWYSRLACHGHRCSGEFLPPKIFPVNLGLPHTVETVPATRHPCEGHRVFLAASKCQHSWDLGPPWLGTPRPRVK